MSSKLFILKKTVKLLFLLDTLTITGLVNYEMQQKRDLASKHRFGQQPPDTPLWRIEKKIEQLREMRDQLEAETGKQNGSPNFNAARP